MVRSPQTTRGRALAAILAGLLGVTATASAHAEPPRPPAGAPAKVPSPRDEMDQEIEATPCSPEDRQRALALLVASALLRSPYETTPPVVQPPKVTPSDEQPGPGDDNPNPNPQTAPEPATLLTGTVGSGLALLAWWRNRRRRPEVAPE